MTAGLRLRGLATAAIDLSDGLAGDLSHVLRASRVGAIVDAERLPGSDGLRSQVTDLATRLAFQARGGDDYELCLCIPEGLFEGARASIDVPLTAIGRITAEPALRWRDAAGGNIELPPHGYRHFE